MNPVRSMKAVNQTEPRREGFWQSSMEPDLPMPVADVDWPERDAFLGRFAKAESMARKLAYRGMSRCRVCGKTNGCQTMSLNGWEWPSGFLHYVRDHGVKPSDDFIAFVDAVADGTGTGASANGGAEGHAMAVLMARYGAETPAPVPAAAAIPTNDAETIAALKADTPLNRARAAFSHSYGRIEQAHGQRKGPTIIESRRMEFEAVAAIAKALGVEIPAK